jgi:hypothetical protein
MKPNHRRAWRAFDSRDRAAIAAQLEQHRRAQCPRCAAHLEAQPSTRLAAVLPRGARGYDLDCRGCRRFHARVTLSQRSLYNLRIRRLALAVMRA